MTRREWIAAWGAAPLLRAATGAPAAPVALAACPSYDADVTAVLNTLLDQLGGLGGIVRGKTVTIKLNLTGNAATRLDGRPPGVTHFVHPKLVFGVAQLMGKAGARRIRFVESPWATGGPIEEFLLDAGWNVRSLATAAPGVEFENSNNLGKGKRYARFKVPGGGYIFPAYDLNHAFEETDVLVSMAKLKNHQICGVTLSLKNCFGNAPASIYGDDAGVDEPNESPGFGRVKVLHEGKRQPSKSAPREIDPSSSRDPGYRIPRIVADLVAARPVDLAIIDGIQAIAGGEGPWAKGARLLSPGVLMAGRNPVCTDAVAMAVMGYDPLASRGTAPFRQCDNTLALAEKHGVGTADLSRIEVRGVPVRQVVCRYEG